VSIREPGHRADQATVTDARKRQYAWFAFGRVPLALTLLTYPLQPDSQAAAVAVQSQPVTAQDQIDPFWVNARAPKEDGTYVWSWQLGDALP
jgi:hypothetical protein